MPTLFSPLLVLTRFRTDAERAPLLPMVSEYYAQRGSTPGTLLIAEATLVAPQAGGHNRFPGIWSAAQIAAWKKITEAVHARGSYIYLHIWGLGRTADLGAPSGGGYQYTPPTPRALTIGEIKENVRLFAKAASNAVHLAGFDGVEIHSANGVLLDRFLQDVTNERTDEYGGGPANRARLGLEILGAVAKEIGADRMGIRISPWGKYQGMGMADPKPTYTYFVSQMKERWPNMAYLHVTEPRVDSGAELGPDGVDGKERDDESIPAEEENDFLRRIWSPRPFITAGGYTRELAIKAAERGDIVAVGRHFLANPDLPLRWKDDLPSNAYDRSTFNVMGDGTGKGYTDYPFLDGTTPAPWPITTLTSPGKVAEAPSDPPC
ncbi:hypothetical protein PLEOSDRAFT_1102842 [Pleurotus ostreatus PC15]|uniref:NADH:flavin oxidoreductase/NADH oxidase N-terminal domain-containing protein n=1 Tax=Pleurotus ostreatus (strain PC15) TaxID=1137138 RepID=A0A067NYW7_PLEO1|nr:hypothetical protein PLEOSDRAFT_1102842 [Pleurotus ostreatus PC15]